MIAQNILDIKKCTNALFVADTFDDFLLAEAKIVGKMTYQFDGHITPGFFSDEELLEEGLEGEDCLSYANVRKLCFEIIKGKRPPQSFSFVFLCPKKLMADIIKKEGLSVRPEEVSNLTFTIRFVKNELLLVTGATMRGFTLDRSMETAWDDYVRGFFAAREITLTSSI